MEIRGLQFFFGLRYYRSVGTCCLLIRFFEIGFVREAASGVRRVGQGGEREELEVALLDIRRRLLLL